MQHTIFKKVSCSIILKLITKNSKKTELIIVEVDTMSTLKAKQLQHFKLGKKKPPKPLTG